VSQVFTSGCGGPSITVEDDGHITIAGLGQVTWSLAGSGSNGFPAWPIGASAGPRGVLQWTDLIWKYSGISGVPAAFIAATISQESHGQANAANLNDHPNGIGLMQITSAAARQGATNDDLIDPEANISLGTQLLGKLWNSYGGNPIKVAAAYNAGHVACSSKPSTFMLVQTGDYSGNLVKLWNGAVDNGFAPGSAPPPYVPPEDKPEETTLVKASGVIPGLIILAGLGIGAYLLGRKS
jgi:hypothetical protein